MTETPRRTNVSGRGTASSRPSRTCQRSTGTRGRNARSAMRCIVAPMPQRIGTRIFYSRTRLALAVIRTTLRRAR